MAEIVLQAARLDPTEFLYATESRFLSSVLSCPYYRSGREKVSLNNILCLDGEKSRFKFQNS